MAAQEASSIAKKEEQQKAQTKTFTRWCNTHLVKRNVPIADLSTDLKDGTALINLMEIISANSIGKYRKKEECKVKIHRMENLTKALKFIRSEGIKLVNIDGADIEAGNITAILGLIWTIILRFQIQKDREDSKSASAKSDLLAWVNGQIAPKKATNFTSDWQSGDYLCSLLNSLAPDSVTPTGDALTDIEAAMTAAERKFQIPRVLDASDLVNNPDELSVMTYISYYRAAWEKLQRRVADPTKAYAEGPGLVRAFTNDGRGANFTIFSFDENGQPWPAHAATVNVTGPDGKPVVVDLKDNKDGTYKVRYAPTAVGDYKINVLLEGKPIKDMPRVVRATEGADEKKSKANLNLTIQAFLPNGEAKKEGGDRFECFLKRDSEMEVLVPTEDNGDGTYTAKFELVNGGQFRILKQWSVRLLLNGTPLPGSPFLLAAQ